MKLFVEGYHYDISSEYSDILRRFGGIPNADKTISTEYVGYAYVKDVINDCVFILPKTIYDKNGNVFGLRPDDIIDVKNSKLNGNQKDFLHGLGVWIYRALKRYGQSKEKTSVLLKKTFSQVANGKPSSGTLLDVFLSLKNFYDANRDFFIFTMRNVHSQRHRIDWPRTIANTSAFFQDDVPLYLNPIGRKRCIDWDEELMTIFFSVLNYMNSFGFNINIDLNYDIIKGEKFKSYLSGLGINRMRSIKHRYFSDKTKQIWTLCYAFFKKSEEISASRQDAEILMATLFEKIFEEMVDALIGDPTLADKKTLNDNKIIDHIFTYRSLFSTESVYYIGDSKYYRDVSGPQRDSHSTFKQFSYARNIVNNWILDNMRDAWPYRDNLTEGYVVIPNFFINARINDKLKYETDDIACQDAQTSSYQFRQFVNRLFDRDTLWVRQYNLNFLYLISVYASGNKAEATRFKEKAYKFFRERTIALLNEKYEFWRLTPKVKPIPDEVKWQLRGMSYALKNGRLLLAIQKPDRSGDDCKIENDVKLIAPIIRANFEYQACALSTNDSFIVIENSDKRSFSFDLEDKD